MYQVRQSSLNTTEALQQIKLTVDMSDSGIPYFLRARLRDRCPFPTGVANGPLSPILFLWTESIAAWGIPKVPSTPFTGVTSTGSQSIGA